MSRLYTCARALLVSAGLGLAVSGCGVVRSWLGSEDVDTPAPPPPAPPLAALPVAPPVATSIAPPPPPARRTVPVPAAPRLSRPLMPAPVISVAGLGEDEVRRVLGEPQERAEVDGRRTWTYRGDGCRVEVTFFRDVTRGTWSALAHKVFRAGTEVVDTRCARETRRAAG